MRKTVTYWLCVASVLLFSAFAGKMAALPADDAWQSVFPGSGETLPACGGTMSRENRDSRKERTLPSLLRWWTTCATLPSARTGPRPTADCPPGCPMPCPLPARMPACDTCIRLEANAYKTPIRQPKSGTTCSCCAASTSDGGAATGIARIGCRRRSSPAVRNSQSGMWNMSVGFAEYLRNN